MQSSGMNVEERPGAKRRRVTQSNRLREVQRRRRHLPAGVLFALLAMFLILQSFMPLRTAITIGADEGFELSRVVLAAEGYRLYFDIWNDQPPLYTFLLTQLVERFSASIYGLRLVTTGFTVLLLTALFLMCLRVSGLLVAGMATGFLILSPGFLELSSSCMVEIPGLAPVMAALCVLAIGPRTKWRGTEMVAGVLFAIGLQIKLIGMVYLPLLALLMWLRERAGNGGVFGGGAEHYARGGRGPQSGAGVSPGQADLAQKGGGRKDACTTFRRKAVGSTFTLTFTLALAVFGMSMVLAFIAINYATSNPLLVQLQQAWVSHFAPTHSFEYGSPSDKPFDWGILLKNWDATIPALIGAIFLLSRVRQFPGALLPLAWLGLTWIVFSRHEPWWEYYYIHNAVPVVWCAAVGFAIMWKRLTPVPNPLPAQMRGEGTGARRRGTGSRPGPLRQNWPLAGVLGVWLGCSLLWMGARVHLQIVGIRTSAQTYHSVALREIERFRHHTTYLFTDDPVYSFHAGIPMPPELAMLSLKRFWSGDMTNARLAAELEAAKPGIILLKQDTRELPFQDLMNREYRVVYQDATHRLFAHRSVAKQAGN